MNGDKSLLARAEGVAAGLAGSARRLRDLADSLDSLTKKSTAPASECALLRLFAQQVRSEADGLAPAPHANETKTTKGTK